MAHSGVCVGEELGPCSIRDKAVISEAGDLTESTPLGHSLALGKSLSISVPQPPCLLLGHNYTRTMYLTDIL